MLGGATPGRRRARGVGVRTAPRRRGRRDVPAHHASRARPRRARPVRHQRLSSSRRAGGGWSPIARSWSAVAHSLPTSSRSSGVTRATDSPLLASSTTVSTATPRPSARTSARWPTSSGSVAVERRRRRPRGRGESSTRPSCSNAVRSPECARLRPARRAPPPRLRHADRHRGPHRLGTDHADPDAAARRRQLGAQEGLRCPPRRGHARGARAGDGCVCARRAPGGRARRDLPSGPRRPRRRQFKCFKFRSMRPGDERESATQWSIVDDERVGPVGRVLRRTSLDELPQLWNILRGRHDPGRPPPGAPALRARSSPPSCPATASVTASPQASPVLLRSAACAAPTPRSPTAPGSTTTTSRTGRSGSTPRSSCARSARSSSPAVAEHARVGTPRVTEESPAGPAA